MADIQSNIDVNIDTSDAVASLKSLQRQISAFYTSMSSAAQAANGSLANMQQNLINTINQTGQFSAQLSKVQSTAEAFTAALEKNKLSLSQYFKFAAGASKKFGNVFKTEQEVVEKTARERVKDLQTQYIKLGRDATGAIQTIKVRPLTLDMKDLGTQTAIAAQKQQILNQLMKQGSTQLLNFGKNTQWAGRQLMVGFTIPLSMLGTTAAKTFMEMEKQAISFKRVYGDAFTTTAETNQALQNVRDLATEFTKYGVAAEATMGLAAKAAAAGKTGGELIAQVRQANRLAVLGQVEQSDALETTMSITNAFGTAATDLTKKINFLNAVENQTVTSIEDLTTAIPKAGPVVKQLGGDVEDLAFFLTAMKEGGINASEGANALKSGLASLINPTAKASEFLAGFGINIKQIVDANKGDVKGIVVDFATALDKLDPTNRARAIEQMFGKFQFARLSTLFQNVIKDGSQASRVLELTGKSSSELAGIASKELGSVAASSMYKFQKSVEDLRVQLAPVGEIFLKIATPIVEAASNILESFNKMDEKAKLFITGLISVVGGLGPVLLMTFGLIANGVANIIKGFTLVRNLFNKTGDSSTFLGEQTDYMTQQQLEAAAAASSLEQVHQKLEQRFTSEAGAIDKLTAALSRAVTAQNAYRGTSTGKPPATKKYASGVVSVPGPKGAGDIVPAMLSPGEAVIPTDKAQKYRGLIDGIIAGSIPGFKKGISDISDSDIGGAEEWTRFASTRPIQQAHAVLPFTEDSPEFAEGVSKLKGLPKEFRKFATVVSNLVVDLPSQFNQIMKSSLGGRGVESKRFLNTYNARGLKFAQSGLEGGLLGEKRKGIEVLKNLSPEEAKLMAGLQDLENEIGQRAAQIADAENDGKVRDIELDKATKEVIAKYKDQATAIGKAAAALNKQAQTLSAVRLNVKTKDMQDLVASGKVKQVMTDATHAKYQVMGTEGKMVTIARGKPKNGEVGDIRPEGAYESSQMYKKRRQKSYGGQYLSQPMDQIGDNILGQVAKSVDKASQSNSPSKKAIEASSKNIVDGTLQPVTKSKTQAKKAGDSFIRNVGDAIPSTTNTKFVTRKVQELVSRALAAYNIGGVAGTQRVSVVAPTTTTVVNKNVETKKRDQKPTVVPVAVVADNSKAIEENTDQTKRGTRNYARMMDVAQKASFAMMSLSGAVSMFGSGPLSDISSQIMTVTGLFYGLTSVIELVTQANLASLIITRAKNVADATGGFAKVANTIGQTVSDLLMIKMLKGKGAKQPPFVGMTKAGPIAKMGEFLGKVGAKFSGWIAKAVPFLGRFVGWIGAAVKLGGKFLGPWGWIATGIVAVVEGFQWFMGMQKEQEAKLKGFSDAVTISTDKLTSWTDLLGLERVPTAMESALAGAPVTATNRTTTGQALAWSKDETFTDVEKGFGAQIEQMKTATQAEAMAILSTVSTTLAAQGAASDQIDAVIQAIQLAAKNKNVKVEFASIDFSTTKGRQGIVDSITKLLGDYEKEFNDPTNQRRVFVGNRGGGKMVNKPTDEFKGTITETAQTVQTNLNNLATMAANGMLTGEEFNSLWSKITNTLKNTSGGILIVNQNLTSMATAARAAGNTGLATQLDNTANSTLGLSDKMFATQLVMTGLVTTGAGLASVLKDLEIVANANGEYSPSAVIAATARINAYKAQITKATDEQKKYTDSIKDTNDQLGKEKTLLEQFVESISGKITGLYNSRKAYNKLVTAGIDTTTAASVANDELFAKLISQTKVGTKEWKNIIAWVKKYKEEVAKGPAKTPEERMIETVDAAIANINNRKNVIELTFQVNTTADRKIVSAAEAAIDALQVKVDDYEAGLTRMEDKEQVINDVYDKRLDALDEIQRANQRIAEQKNAELSISQSLARGDIGAAAAAIQAEQQRQAEEAFNLKKDQLEKKRKSELEGLTTEVTVGYDAQGKAITKMMTRNQIETELKDLKKKIFDIEEKTLEPAKERIRLQEVAKNNAIDELNLLGKNLSEWELIKGKIESSITSTDAYLAKIEAGIVLLEQQKNLWNDINNGGFGGNKTVIPTGIPDAKRSPQLYASWVAAGSPDPTKSPQRFAAWANSVANITSNETSGGASVGVSGVPDYSRVGTLPYFTSDGQGGSSYNDKYQQVFAGAQIPAPETSKTTLLNWAKKQSDLGELATENPAGGIYRAIQMWEKHAKATGPEGEMYRNKIARALLSLDDIYQNKASGGIIKPAYFNIGGFAKGTDTVPAMLTPGEFIMSKYAVDTYGVDTMKAINSGNLSGGSMYNSYQVNVNVRSDANPDQIARAVMGQIRQVNNQQLRGNKF